MRNQIAHVKNIRALSSAGTALLQRAPGVPGIGLLWGRSGFGKSTAAAWWAVKVNAIYVRAAATWTPFAMLGAIMRELGAAPMSRTTAMLEYIVQTLALPVEQQRPLIIDEADYLVRERLLDTLRDIHDLSSAPLVLIGMHDFKRKVVFREQLHRRITQWVEFRPTDIEDAGVLAHEVCEVELDEGLLDRLHSACGGSIGQMVTGLSRIEAFGRRSGKSKVTAKEWGTRGFTLSSDTEA